MPERKIAIITGASGGIGKNLVFNFENADYKVIALDLVEPTYKLAGVDYMSIDVSDSDNVRDVFAEIHKKYPKTHVLINNAAISNFRKDIFDITDEEFKNVIDVNLCGTFFCSRAFIGHNHTCRFGRIINIASTRFNQNEAGWDAYGASKGGIVALTASMSVSLSASCITVNAISPGWIQTHDYQSLSKQDHLQHPSRRVGMPDDISRMALFLCQDKNDFINGQNFIVDGGMTKKMVYI